MDKNTLETMFSSKSTKWATPQDFYDELNKVHNFTLDPCASDKNHKCKKYFTEKDDGLAQSWAAESVFMNPPYGRDIKKWLKKAWQEGQKSGTKVVCLIPARTDTKYWHDYCMNAAKIHFIKGRLKFGDSKNSAPFPSALVIFDSTSNRQSPEVTPMSSSGKLLWSLTTVRTAV